MSEELITIEAALRTATGKGVARKLRNNDLIPANLLEKGKATSIELNPKWLSKVVKSTNKFNLSLNGTTKVVEIKELQVDAVKRTALHVDLVYV